MHPVVMFKVKAYTRNLATVLIVTPNDSISFFSLRIMELVDSGIGFHFIKTVFFLV